MTSARVPEENLYILLRRGRIEEFNELRKQVAAADLDLTGMDLSGLDLRHADFRGLDLSRCHFGKADLRGVNFSQTRLEGAMIDGAKICGTCFPKELAPEEINLSLVHGTCMRYR